MAKLTFTMMTSLDNYINDIDGDFNWGHISDDVHQHANDAQREISLDIYGRRMYEMMVYWETYDGNEAVALDFSDAWKSVDKLVVSKSLTSVSSARTALVADLDIDAMRKLKAGRDGAIAISGPTLASRYLDAGLVDEVSIYYIPVVVGGGTRMFQGRNKLKVERIDERSFSNGVSFMSYRVLN
jgi:dihydrofolate reductase